ncbi:MAG: histidine kinase [Cyclobacteriaceae bacterium]|jgi:two-component system, LytTR family, sensor kinase|nr:histidine kinase [Cyclobacteriaceae bacterium]
MKWLDAIPRIWKRAYLLICLWYAINFTISAVLEWRLVNPEYYVLWTALFLLEALCVFILLIFIWSHWLFKFSYAWQVTGHVLGIIIFFLVMGTLSYYFTDYLEGFVYLDHWKEYMVGLLGSWDALRIHDQYIITVGVYYVIRYFQGLQSQEQEKSELAIRNKEMQISLLKSQINPHFLFNTLNSISTLVHTSKEQARKVISQLSDIFRYALDSHNGEMVKLVHEIEFIENYVRIQQVRFGDRLKFQKDIDVTCLGVSLPPMILQPLVENSVKYGIAPKDEGGTIFLTVRRSGSVIFFEVKDNGLGSKAKKVLDGSSSGVGMINTDLRLKSYFGVQSHLRVLATDHGYSVSFFIEDKSGVNKHVPKSILENQLL